LKTLRKYSRFHAIKNSSLSDKISHVLFGSFCEMDRYHLQSRKGRSRSKIRNTGKIKIRS